MFVQESLKICSLDKERILIPYAHIKTHSLPVANKLCRQAYYKHPKGCPNYNKREDCPPNTRHIFQQYDPLSIHILCVKFPFLEYISLKELQHPDWTVRALANQRHWQGHLKAQIRDFWEDIKDEYPQYKLIENPEGQGVNLVQTLSQYDINLQWCKQNSKGEIVSVPEYMYQVNLIGKEILPNQLKEQI